MNNDRWKARVKGRRALLKVWLLGAAGWVGVGLRNTALSVLLTQTWNALTVRREQTTKPRTYTYVGSVHLHIRGASSYRFIPGIPPSENGPI